jgi:protein O-mannosyl-transferase
MSTLSHGVKVVRQPKIQTILDTAMNDSRAKVVICIFLMVATFCIYSQLQDHEFINFDDDLYITDNLNVQAGLTGESFKWVFTTSHPPYWHPMTWLSHMLDYQLYGLHPKGHHLTNIFIHISSVLILFIVLLRMTGAFWQSGFVAAMFAFHPLNVESVAWIAERKNVLSTLFWLLTMWAYIHYAERPTVKRYGLVFLFFTLGLMSKPMLVTLPFVLLLLDYWPLRRLKFEQERSRDKILEKNTAKKPEVFQLVLEKVPLFLLTVGLSIVTVHLQSIAGAVKSLDVFPLQARLTNAVFSYLEYLGKMIWPSGLSILYPHPGNALPVWQGILSGMVLVGITIISIRLIRKAPYFAVGWFWYLGTLVPVIGIVQVGGQAMADRFSYIPLIGIFIIVAWGVPGLISKWSHKGKVLFVSAGIVIFALLITTWKQTSHWKNSIAVYNHAIRVTDKKYSGLAVIHNNLGISLFADQKSEEAISHFKMAIKLRPSYDKAHFNLGVALFSEQKNKEAISHYKMATNLNPNYTAAHFNLGVALFADRKNEEAIYHLKMAIKLKPTYTTAHFNLGVALLAGRKNGEAISHYKIAIKLNPNYTNAHYNLGVALLQKEEMKEAVHHFKEALRLKPDFIRARDYLELALIRSQELK